jgi:uncharacterized protein YkwD
MSNNSLDASAVASTISGYRRRNGLAAVELDPKLMAMAQAKARDMAASHRIDHARFQERLQASGFNAVTGSENIAVGTPTFADAFSGWKGSAPHRANMLMPGATHMGIAAVYVPKDKYGTFWVLVIAGIVDRKRQIEDVRRGPLQLPVGPPSGASRRKWGWLGW